MDPSKVPYPVSISVCTRTGDVPSNVITTPTTMVGFQLQANPNPIQVAAPSESKIPISAAIPAMLTTPLDYNGSQPTVVHVAPSMMAVDRVLNALSDQDQASSDLEVQSVMCPETRNLLPTLKPVCTSRSSSSSKSSKSSYSPMRLQISMTNTKRGNVQSVTPTCLYNYSIHQLAAQGEIAVLEEKFQEELDIDELDADGCTPLMWACAHQQTDIVQHLLAHGADVTKESVDGETALAFASSVGCIDIIRLLLTEGADVNKSDWNEGTPLLYAVYKNHPVCVRLLLEAGADLTVQTEGGHTPLSLAVALGHREVQLTIEKHMISLLQNG
ncbi:ankyrin repeat family A protein 2-like [Acanthaster planci]|uniref:Ankyrin repeat family A protein 2-like n=1 Tax=Acanthaster planci TaxID=133434 RepID=A0A8B7Z5C7_ACAPL|nr:ankyrin repeat family A protein 2-like [Acanthaster planci]XP_022100838.1 ankyrin repeat family A protein 2-like [Acanthaster planci]